jgi:putative ABC transport system permease protein
MDKAPQPEVYVPYAENSQNPATFVMRSSVDTESLISAARQTVRAVDRDLLLTDVTTLTDLVRDATGDERFRTTLLSLFAGVALFLAALGIYGVLAYFVSQRSRELGIRLALGARPQSVFSLVVRQGMQPVAAGVVGGVIAALGFTGTMESLLFGITPLDPPTYAAAIATLAAAALTACALPAARATRLDPLVALRYE